MSSTVILKAAGLITSPNQLDVPDGALNEADNIIIKRDGVVEPRRGFFIYGDALPNESDRAKQLSIYRDRILRHYDSTLQYDSDGQGTFKDFAGTFEEAEVGRRVKSVESNGNYYFTTSEGIKKISTSSASELDTTQIIDAGASKALDLTATLIYQPGLQTGFLPQDSTVAYRLLWNYNDANDNLVRGTPSQRAVVYFPLEEFVVLDFMRVLEALDNITDTTNNTRINDNDYVSSLGLGINSLPSEIRANLISLASKIDNDIQYAQVGAGSAIDLTGATIEVNGGVCTITKVGANFDDFFTSGKNLELQNLASANQLALNENFIVATVDADTITFTTSAADFVSEALDGSATLVSYDYRAISEPVEPSTPATNAQLTELQTYLDTIIRQLQNEPPIGVLSGVVISTTNQTDFISPLDITTTANVQITATVPNGINDDYYYQLYRSATSTARQTTVLEDLVPNDEMQQVFEKFYDGVSSSITITDSSPEDFKGQNLYTNPSTGEGITQANDIPPFAKDINRFRNVVFYANTRTRHRLQATLLGVQNIISDINNSLEPKLSITTSLGTNTYNFVLGQQEVWDLTLVDNSADQLNGLYLDLTAANNAKTVRFYWQSKGLADAAPADGGFELKPIYIDTGALANDVASKTKDVINTYANYFIAEDNTLPTIRITNFDEGSSSDLDLGTSAGAGVTRTLVQQGVGEDESTNTVLVSNVVSPARAVDLTARSLVRVINKNSSESIYAYYLSSVTDVPGQILFESRSISDIPFYIQSNIDSLGESINPDATSEFTITNIDQPTSVITTDSNHGYVDGQNVVISFTDTVPAINGIYQVEVISANEFKVPVELTTVNSNDGNVSSLPFIQKSTNEEKPNRIYYSKFQRPEAVPIVNYFDVGAEDNPIYRIFPLRDSLFVFKEDGLYRVSGEVSPFNVQLFDSSAILIADDTVSVANNVLYAWTTQGISVISESGVQIISRPIDVDILKLNSSRFPNFRAATWGIGYESDNSYTVYTVQKSSDAEATIGYRYSNLTGTWTNITKTATCGAVNTADDKLYLGAGDTNYIEKERKNFDRTDYADREFANQFGNDSYSEAKVILADISNLEVGDVVTQNQLLTIFEYNMILKQLDNDSSLSLSKRSGDTGYYETLKAIAGNNMRTKIEQLAARLDADTGLADNDYASTIATVNVDISSIDVANPGVVNTVAAHGLIDGRKVILSSTDSNPVVDSTYTATVIDSDSFSIPVSILGAGTTGNVLSADQDFEDIKVCYNKLVEKLNDDPLIRLKNYQPIDTETLQEVIITAINPITREVTFNVDLQFIAGPVTSYKAIKSAYTYAPNTMGDPLGLKHLRYAQLLVESRDFTSGTFEFATDLKPQFQKVNFDLDGNGIFGVKPFGTGKFGGKSSSAPIPTYIPRNCQRCTFMRVRFTHNIAREKYSIYGTTLTGEVGISERAYR